jgi:hypothetical protein
MVLWSSLFDDGPNSRLTLRAGTGVSANLYFVAVTGGGSSSAEPSVRGSDAP